jgi:DNA-binding IclR family transcriptional regulator
MTDSQPDLTGPQEDIACILAALYQGGIAARPSLSLAALSKRIDMRMSTLMRYLTSLQEEGWVAVSSEAGGSKNARLTPVGEKMCEEWWGAAG